MIISNYDTEAVAINSLESFPANNDLQTFNTVNIPSSDHTDLILNLNSFVPSEAADSILGTEANDTIFSLAGNDTVLGLTGDDILGGNQDNDFLLGNLGNDTLYAGKGDDTLTGGQNNDILFGDIGNDTLFGDRGEDEVLGNQGDDIIYGGKEADLVAGGAGNDLLFGDLGNDTLLGDRGADTITGGDGNDTFYIGEGTGGFLLTEADIINDFNPEQDAIGLLNLLSFDDLNIYQGTDEFASDTIIQNKNTNEFLAILKNVNSNTLNSDDFTLPDSDNEPTPTPTPTPVGEPTPTPTPTPVGEPTPTPVGEPTPTPTPVVEPTPTPVVEPTPTPVVEPTPTPTPVGEPTPTPTPVVEPTPTPVGEPTPTPVVEPTPTPVVEPTPTPTPVGEPTPTPVVEPTPTPVGEPTPTPVVEPTPTPVVEPTPTPTPVGEPTPTPVVEPTPTPVGEPTPTPVVEPTPTPVVEPTPTPVVEPTPTPTPVVEPTPTPVGEPTPTPVVEPTPTPVGEPTPTPVVEPTPTPVVEPTPTPVVEPTPTPVVEPTPTPTPVVEPTPTPVVEPTPTPVGEPTPTPTPVGEPTPTPTPVVEPTPTPVVEPTPTPVGEPTPTPTPVPEPVPQPTPTPTPVPEPVPQPTPTPTPVPGKLEFSVASINVDENATNATITVNRIEGTDGIVTVDYATENNTALAGIDYTATSGTLTFADGETSKSFTIPILEDTAVEGNEFFNLNLTNATGDAILGMATSTVNIVDNDVLMPGSINFSAATFSVNEDGTPITEITVTRTGGSLGAVSINLTQTNGTATSPGDYTNAPITVNFADGDSTPQIVTIPIINDTTFEPTESINLALATPTGGATLGTQNTATLQIVDNDRTSNLQLTGATYLGTANDDVAKAVEISPTDQAIIVAGNFNGAGQIRRLTDANTAPLSTTVLGGQVNDMDVDRDSGEIVAVGSFGIKVYNPNAGTVLWSQAGTFDRVAIANNGTIATLTNSNDRVTLWSPAGSQLATTTLTGTDIRPADIAINPTTNQVYVTGFNQVTSTLQTPFIRAFDTNLNQIWNTWDYSAAQVTGQNLGADTRGIQITFGQNGGLYFLGKTDGGNNVFQRDGEAITQPLATRVQVDKYNSFAGAGSGSFTFHAKINPSDGSIERGQFILTSNSQNKPNSFNPNSITADEFGNVYIGASSAARLQNRDTQQINGQTVGNYTSDEIAVIGLTPDYTVRKFWTPFTQSGDTDGSKGEINGFAVRNGKAAIFSTITRPAVATTPGAINPNPLGGNDAYLAIWNV
ncbi:Calx-beta domain-containing protein [Capilliphycus salinus ALCB114379]|uniref:Calx-beta domain-containing protein n=1 Tax=Capilliphycus salinus TaxID=2768948 RepID=UPI0039A52F84